MHHQGIKALASALVVSATAPDGLIEAASPDRELFGMERLVPALTRSMDVDLATSVSRLIDDVDRWRGGQAAKDDVSVLAVECA